MILVILVILVILDKYEGLSLLLELNLLRIRKLMARPIGFEPMTYGLEVRSFIYS